MDWGIYEAKYYGGGVRLLVENEGADKKIDKGEEK